MKLVIGNKNYSTWSLRPWLFMHANGMAFEEIQESLRSEQLSARLSQYSESCRVPVLLDGDISVWDSLAICEYISENYLDGKGWPTEKKARAEARAICAEMHSGFSALRSELPMNCRLKKDVEISEAAKKDIKRIESIWSQYATQLSDGSFRLFGQFSIADCFYAPVALRFKSYGISVSGVAEKYAESLLSHPSVQHWVSQALEETEIVEEDEV